ncbi:MAG: hypothetical protein ACI8RA_001638, partial [Chlamydiales bacterium]
SLVKNYEDFFRKDPSCLKKLSTLKLRLREL